MVYRGADAADKFVDYMVKEQEEIEQKLRRCKPVNMMRGDWKSYKKATQCHICLNELRDDSIRVIEHCHITGKFRGAAHKECNINFKFTGRIPVVFHNLRGYDHASYWKGPQKTNVHTQQHGEVYFFLNGLYGFY